MSSRGDRSSTRAKPKAARKQPKPPPRQPKTPRKQPKTSSKRTSAVSPFTRAVIRAVKRIPHGRVASYGDIAAAIGSPQSARAVGSALQALPDDANAPWWRVINGRGTISPGGGLHRARLQRELLQAEEIRFDRTGRTDFATFGWRRKRRQAD